MNKNVFGCCLIPIHALLWNPNYAISRITLQFSALIPTGSDPNISHNPPRCFTEIWILWLILRMSFFCSKKNLSNSHFQLATEAYTSAVWKLKVGRDKQMKCPSWLGESILCDVSLPTTCCILHNDIMCIYIFIIHMIHMIHMYYICSIHIPPAVSFTISTSSMSSATLGAGAKPWCPGLAFAAVGEAMQQLGPPRVARGGVAKHPSSIGCFWLLDCYREKKPECDWIWKCVKESLLTACLTTVAPYNSRSFECNGIFWFCIGVIGVMALFDVWQSHLFPVHQAAWEWYMWNNKSSTTWTVNLRLADSNCCEKRYQKTPTVKLGVGLRFRGWEGTKLGDGEGTAQELEDTADVCLQRIKNQIYDKSYTQTRSM